VKVPTWFIITGYGTVLRRIGADDHKRAGLSVCLMSDGTTYLEFDGRIPRGQLKPPPGIVHMAKDRGDYLVHIVALIYLITIRYICSAAEMMLNESFVDRFAAEPNKLLALAMHAMAHSIIKYYECNYVRPFAYNGKPVGNICSSCSTSGTTVVGWLTERSDNGRKI